MRATVPMLLLLAWTNTARADWTYSLDPASASSGQVVNVRVDDSLTGCFPSQNPQVVRQGTIATITFSIDDFLPPNTPPGTCPPERVTPRFFPLGTFAPGNYEILVVTCTNAPPPDECMLQATLPLAVFGSSGVFTVPAAGKSALFFLAMALGVAAIRLRSR